MCNDACMAERVAHMASTAGASARKEACGAKQRAVARLELACGAKQRVCELWRRRRTFLLP